MEDAVASKQAHMIARRNLITGIGALLAAPALVRATSIMPVKIWDAETKLYYPCNVLQLNELNEASLEKVWIEIQRSGRPDFFVDG